MISLGAQESLSISPAAPSRIAVLPRRRNCGQLPRLCAPCYYFCKCTQKKRFIRPLRAKNATPPRFYAFPHRLLRASAPCAGIRSAGLYTLHPPYAMPAFSKPSCIIILSPHSLFQVVTPPFPSPAFSFPSHQRPFPLLLSKLLPPLCAATARPSLSALREGCLRRQCKR